jgi:hypothetical protein
MKLHPLRFLVIEYIPHMMDNRKLRPARIDGHYQHKHHAEEVAQLWAEKPIHPESRIVVAEVHSEAKAPAHWLRSVPA